MMLEISFQNQLEDANFFADYMASKTQEGKALGRAIFLNLQWMYLSVSLLNGILLSFISNSNGLGVMTFFVILVFLESLTFIRTKFQPIYVYAKQAYLAQDNKLTEKRKKLITLPRKLTANEDYIEISSSFSLRRCKWVCIEKIEITSDFIYIFINGCPTYYLPKRDFNSDQVFLDFGVALKNLKYEFDIRNIDFS